MCTYTTQSVLSSNCRSRLYLNLASCIELNTIGKSTIQFVIEFRRVAHWTMIMKFLRYFPNVNNYVKFPNNLCSPRKHRLVGGRRGRTDWRVGRMRAIIIRIVFLIPTKRSMASTAEFHLSHCARFVTLF